MAEARQPYRLYLDPSQAEQVLAAIKFQPRLLGENWLEVVGTKKNDTYAVRSGDSLWNISSRSFSNPRLWPKLWAVNPELNNPHVIEPGQSLRYYRKNEWDILDGVPIIKLRPGTGGNAISDLDTDSYSTKTIDHRYRATLVLLDNQDIYLGEVTGAYAERKNFMDYDIAYVRFKNPESASIGDTFSVIREEGDLEDDTKETRLGTIARVVGEVQVLSLGKEHARVLLRSVTDTFQRGDRLVEFIPPVEVGNATEPPEVEIKILAGEQLESNIFFEGQTVMLDAGSDQGLSSGNLFRAIEYEDAFTETESSVEPWYKAEVQILLVKPKYSIGVIKSGRVALTRGDVLVPAQRFATERIPGSTLAVKEIIEID